MAVAFCFLWMVVDALFFRGHSAFTLLKGWISLSINSPWLGLIGQLKNQRARGLFFAMDVQIKNDGLLHSCWNVLPFSIRCLIRFSQIAVYNGCLLSSCESQSKNYKIHLEEERFGEQWDINNRGLLSSIWFWPSIFLGPNDVDFLLRRSNL